MKTLVLISGKMRSGKNQFADYLNVALMSKGKTSRQDLFANDVKKGCEEDFDYMMNQINTHIKKIKTELQYSKIDTKTLKDVKNLLDELMVTRRENWYENKTLISRLLLQTYGTQIFRDRVNKNHWVDQVLNRFFESNEEYTLVTDTRFENEVDYVKEQCKKKNLRVVTLRIERNMPMNNLYEHDSEKGLDNYKDWNLLVKNDGTLEDLQDIANAYVNTLIEI